MKAQSRNTYHIFERIMSYRIRVFGNPICSYNKFRDAGVVFGRGANCFPCEIKNLLGMGFGSWWKNAEC